MTDRPTPTWTPPPPQGRRVQRAVLVACAKCHRVQAVPGTMRARALRRLKGDGWRGDRYEPICPDHPPAVADSAVNRFNGDVT